MNILYFTLDDFDSLENYKSINTDLLREFLRHGHKVYVLSPSERKKRLAGRVIEEGGAIILKPRIGNIQKTNIVEKGISTLTIGPILIKAIKTYLQDTKFDLILYCTPPITFIEAIRYVKNRDRAKTYLLLKDIFPQNAVDIGILTIDGLKGLIYKYFRNQEKRLYSISDRIGCMSQANAEYVIKNNPEVNPAIVEVCPNAIEVIDKSVNEQVRVQLRKKYGIPTNKIVFLYGGNLGKPQGIPFVVECLKRCEKIEDAYFVIIGDGTELHILQDYIEIERPQNVKLIRRLPRDDYDSMVGACDVGLIFLDYRFSIPNFPSRMLSYMAAKIPVLACTDPNTDIGKVIVEGEFGWWCVSNSIDGFEREIMKALEADRISLGERAFNYLKSEYEINVAFETIMTSTDM